MQVFESREYWVGLIRMSLSRFFVFHVLYSGPLHGYEITRRVASLTGGCCAPTEGTIYPILRELEDGGYVTVEIQATGARERKVYTLTARGREAYHMAAACWREAAGYVLQVAGKGHDRSRKGGVGTCLS
ncbi:MAG: PadR family transcriptional regulator [Thermoanaerobacterales bacterium]|nr:PadR family transcriptional regulator [Bacillota bacterium]MDI6908072.1 PadR family transcriptional regulator [Thermoanaerobacterales bacterium]